MKTVVLTAAATLLLVLLGGGDPRSQQLSTSVFPSEDEIFQALRSGDITWDQYLILQEIITQGLDSTNRHLLDEIPNLAFFETDSTALTTRLEYEQQTPFRTSSVPAGTQQHLRGRINHAYYCSLDHDGRSRYSSSVELMLKRNISADVKLRRELSGRERAISRTITYRGGLKTIRRITLGNFSTRFGLGTVFGHRGKLLDYSDDLDTESLTYPDYGGSNGALIVLSAQPWQMNAAVSFNRDCDYRLASAAGLVTRTLARFQPGLVWGINRLTNRETNQTATDLKYGLTAHYRYGRSYADLEVTMQSGERSSPGALVCEGSHRFQSAQVKYAGWLYSDDYVDLAGGSKAATMQHRDRLEKIDFEYPTKRTGQRGGLVKTVMMPAAFTELATSVVYGAFSADTTDIQWLVELTGKPATPASISLDYLTRIRRTLDTGGKIIEAISRQTRLGARYGAEKLHLRTNVAYHTKSTARDYISVFFNLVRTIDAYGAVELWANISKFDHNDGKVNAWYAYASNSFRLSEHVHLAIKLSHTFRRGASSEHQTAALFDIGVVL